MNRQLEPHNTLNEKLKELFLGTLWEIVVRSCLVHRGNFAISFRPSLKLSELPLGYIVFEIQYS